MVKDKLENFRTLVKADYDSEKIARELGVMGVLFIGTYSRNETIIYLEDKYGRVIVIRARSKNKPIIAPSHTKALDYKDDIANEVGMYELLTHKKDIDFASLGNIDYLEARALIDSLQDIRDEYDISDRIELMRKAAELGLINIYIES